MGSSASTLLQERLLTRAASGGNCLYKNKYKGENKMKISKSQLRRIIMEEIKNEGIMDFFRRKKAETPEQIAKRLQGEVDKYIESELTNVLPTANDVATGSPALQRYGVNPKVDLKGADKLLFIGSSLASAVMRQFLKVYIEKMDAINNAANPIEQLVMLGAYDGDSIRALAPIAKEKRDVYRKAGMSDLLRQNAFEHLLFSQMGKALEEQAKRAKSSELKLLLGALSYYFADRGKKSLKSIRDRVEKRKA